MKHKKLTKKGGDDPDSPGHPDDHDEDLDMLDSSAHEDEGHDLDMTSRYSDLELSSRGLVSPNHVAVKDARSCDDVYDEDEIDVVSEGDEYHRSVGQGLHNYRMPDHRTDH